MAVNVYFTSTCILIEKKAQKKEVRITFLGNKSETKTFSYCFMCFLDFYGFKNHRREATKGLEPKEHT